MKADFTIRGGRIMNPVTTTDQVQDVVASNTRIIDPQGEMMGCDHVIDISGCIVTPGLIDFHTHTFYEGSGICLCLDFMISQGTTVAVSAGTAETITHGASYKSVIAQSAVRVRSFLTTFSGGQLDSKLCEDSDPCLINLPRMEQIIDKHRDNILGLKTRLSKDVVPDDKRLEYLERIVDLAEELDNKLGTSLRVCVHTTNMPITTGKLAQYPRPGDTFCHCHQGVSNIIVMEDGGILPLVLRAKKRGVVSDTASDKGNFGVDTARRALTAGSLPDIIGSDLTLDKFSILSYIKSLPFVMVKYRTLGMELMSTLRAVTATPARIMGMEGRIGTLESGANAGIVIPKQKDLSLTQKGLRDEELTSHGLSVLQMIMCAGGINFCQSDFFLQLQEPLGEDRN